MKTLLEDITAILEHKETRQEVLTEATKISPKAVDGVGDLIDFLWKRTQKGGQFDKIASAADPGFSKDVAKIHKIAGDLSDLFSDLEAGIDQA